MNQRRGTLWLAVIVAIVGVGVGLRALWRNAPAAIEKAESARTLADEPEGGPKIASTDLGVDFAPTSAEGREVDPALLDAAIAEARTELRERHEALSVEQQVSADRLEALLNEAALIWRIYLSNDYDGYVSLMNATNARFPSQFDVESGSARDFWTTLAGAFLASPIAPRGLQLRPYVVRGAFYEHPDLGSSGKMEAKSRYSLGRSPGDLPEVIYEIALPVRYDDERYSGPVFFSTWLAWSNEQGRWLIWRLSVADPLREAEGLVRPTY